MSAAGRPSGRPGKPPAGTRCAMPGGAAAPRRRRSIPGPSSGRDRPLAAALPLGPMPGWVLTPPPPEPSPPRPLLPSRPNGPEPATLSPLAVAGRDRFKRGLIVHRLLQSLPELPVPERAAAARRFLALPLYGLDEDTQAEICAETLAVLGDPGLAALWGPDAQAEVPVVGL